MANRKSHRVAGESVWLVKWINDTGEAVIHAGSSRETAVQWVVEHFEELHDPDHKVNRARVYALPVDGDWDGVDYGARSISLRGGNLVIIDVDSGKPIEERAQPA